MAYSSRTDVESIYGVTNVAEWADLDNDEDTTKIQTRIDDRIADADVRIDELMAGGPYQLPLEASAGGSPRSITRLSAMLAGVYLYEARGARDVNPETGQLLHRFAGNRKHVEKRLREYQSGEAVLDAVASDDIVLTDPIVVVDTDVEPKPSNAVES